MEDPSTGEDHYEILSISLQNGEILEALKKDCGLYSINSYSDNFSSEEHEYDILSKVNVEENDNVLILSIDNLVGVEHGTYNTIRIFENDLEILKFSDNYHFIDSELTVCNDNYNIYSYANIKIDFQKNEVQVLRNKINDESDLRNEDKSNVNFSILFSVTLLVVILLIIVITKKNKIKSGDTIK